MPKIGLRGLLRRSREKPKIDVRSIIQEYYGGSSMLWAHTFARNIYSIPEVRTAIEGFADIFSTIPIYRERILRDGTVEYMDDFALNVKPNPLQNATQFKKEIITRLMLESNVFVEPIWDMSNGMLKHLYVLPTRSFDFTLADDGRAYVQFYDKSKNPAEKYNLDSLIYLNRFPSLSGGSSNNLGLYETVVQALMQQAVNVASPKKVRALMQSKTGTSGNLKPRDSKGEMKQLEANFADNVEGIAYVDSHWDITPINWQENDVNRELMKMVVETVYNYFGIPASILSCKATELEIAQFVAYKIQPLARQFEQEFTAKLLTQKEYAFGNRYEFDTFALQVKTMSALSQLFSNGIRNGIVNQDECREYIGQPPIPGGLGQKYRASADTVGLDIIDQYELGKFGLKKEGEDGKEGNVPSGTSNP